MITAVDSSILLDVFTADPQHGVTSREALRETLSEGKLVACDIVWAEVGAFFRSLDEAQEAFRTLGIEFSPVNETASLTAGRSWKRYRDAGGPRGRIISDFLIGAHALHMSDRLLSRDRGFFRKYFSDLKILDPSSPGRSKR